MRRWLGTDAGIIALAALVVGGCLPREEYEDCPFPDYITDARTYQRVPWCAEFGGGNTTIGDPCGGLSDDFGEVIEVTKGKGPLVDAFLTERGVLVVTRRGIELVDRNGEQLVVQSVEGLDVATFDGSILVAIRASDFVVFSSDLSELARGVLQAPCDSAALISGFRFVCELHYDDSRFHLYDALTGDLIMSSARQSYGHGPVRRVPGLDTFLSAGFSGFMMFDVASTGTVQAVYPQPWIPGNMLMSPMYAFVGNPATHVISDQGHRICLTSQDCGGPLGLQPDGDLGLLPSKLFFGAMDIDSTGWLHTVVSPYRNDSSTLGPDCRLGCTAERIAVATGVVEASREFDFETSSHVKTWRADPSGGILLGCTSGDASVGHRVMLLPDAP